MVRLCSVACILTALVFGASAQSKSATVLVDVELAIRKPDGTPAGNAAIALQPRDRAMFDPPISDIETQTDEYGIARFKTPEGVYRFAVTVRGVGAGIIGTTEFVPGRIAHPNLPSLLPFGSIDGSFPAVACPGDVIVHVMGYALDKEVSISNAPDAPGHFHIPDVISGEWRVKVTRRDQRCAESKLSFHVEPGQQLRGVTVPAAKPEPQKETPAQQGTVGAPPQVKEAKQPAVWVRGTVRDEKGVPFAGASVMALATHFGSIRMYQITSKALTGKDGNYEIVGEGVPLESLTLVASAPGHPPAWAWPSLLRGKKPKDLAPPVQDLVLPSKGGRLNVTVVRAGQPATGISVAVYLENANLRDRWARAAGSSKEIEDAAYPTAKTDASGLASFNNLLPGRYRILATGKEGTIRNSLYGFGGLSGVTTQSDGIAVRVGETTNYKMNLYEQQNSASFRAEQQDGTPVTGAVATSFGPSGSIQWNSNVQLDSFGSVTQQFDHAGLWQMQVKFRDSALHTFPIREPYFLASGYVAVSPNLDSRRAPTFHALRVEPGSARITVQDVSGDPLRVSVKISDAFSSDSFSGTTDDHGQIIFTGLTSGKKYFIRLASTAQSEVKGVDLGKFLVHPVGAPQVTQVTKDFDVRSLFSRPMPQISELRAEPAIMEQLFVAQPNTETRIVMRAIRLTYVYGVLTPPDGPVRTQWGLWLDYPPQRQGAAIATNPSTGEFVAGPFPPGDVELNFGTDSTHVHHVSVHVGANEPGPIHFDIDVRKYLAEPAGEPVAVQTEQDTVTLGMGGISVHAGGARALSGQVFLADGRTPALGAQMLYFRPHVRIPSLVAMTDAMGTLHPRGLWYAGNGEKDKGDPGPSSPTVVAFLPGACGAVVTTVAAQTHDPLHLVLPRPISVDGRVTVGRRSPDGRPGTIRVLAAYQGQGFLGPYLSLETTADATGSFELGGLTEGEYLVQAVLDDLWLSKPVALHVAGERSKLITLDIPKPGAPVRLQLRDPLGKAAVATTITLDRQGPLATLWPLEWTSDGAGTISIPTLEAGRHTIHVSGVAKPLRFNVPPLPADVTVLQVNVGTTAESTIKFGGPAPYDPMHLY